MEKPKEPYIKITGTIKENLLKKLEKIRANYQTTKGTQFSFSGVLTLILRYGFQAFETKHNVDLDKLPIKQKQIEEEQPEK